MKVTRNILKEVNRLSKEKNTPLLHPEFGYYHHFSFIIWQGKILTWATNKKESTDKLIHGYTKGNKTHAEYEAVKKIRNHRDLSNIAVVNVRLNKQGDFRLSKPCRKCVDYLKGLGIKTVYYSTELDSFERLNL